MEKLYDVVIIGGGPAGVSAAVYAVRGDLEVCLIHNSGSALERADKIENYYGAGRMDGFELYRRGIAQAMNLGVEIVLAEATFAEFDGAAFAVTTTDGVYRGKKLVIATGAARKTAPEYDKYLGKGVSYCAVCDAFFYRKKRVAVLGAGEYAKHELDAISVVAAEATLVTDGETPAFDAPRTVTKKIKRLCGDDRLTGIEFEDGETLELDGLFIAKGIMGSSAIAKSMGVLTDDKGNIAVNAVGMTNIPGLYAAGDCTAGIKQIARAVNEGMIVGLDIIKNRE